MSGDLTPHNQRLACLSNLASERSALLRFAWREDYFSYYYFAYALASGRSFTSGRETGK